MRPCRAVERSNRASFMPQVWGGGPTESRAGLGRLGAASPRLPPGRRPRRTAAGGTRPSPRCRAGRCSAGSSGSRTGPRGRLPSEASQSETSRSWRQDWTIDTLVAQVRLVEGLGDRLLVASQLNHPGGEQLLQARHHAELGLRTSPCGGIPSARRPCPRRGAPSPRRGRRRGASRRRLSLASAPSAPNQRADG